MAKRKKAGKKAGRARKVRIGFIGCGGIAQGHFRRVQEHRAGEVVALCDTADAMIARTHRSFPQLADLPVYTDYRKMIKSEELDAVEIHTPHTLHFEQIMKSLDAGLHVLTEKPLVCTVPHAKKVIDKVKKSRRVLVLSYQRHYQGEFRYIRELIQRGGLGKVQMISAYQGQDWLRGTRGAWRQEPKLSGGGQLNDSASHLIDIILWITGLSAARVSAWCEYFDSKVDINTAMSIEFTNGALGNISICGNTPRFYEDVTIMGEEGALYYRNGKLTRFDRKTNTILEVTGMRGFSNPDANLIDAILHKQPVQSDATGGLRVIELTEAAWKSAAADGKPVRMNPTKGGRRKPRR